MNCSVWWTAPTRSTPFFAAPFVHASLLSIFVKDSAQSRASSALLILYGGAPGPGVKPTQTLQMKFRTNPNNRVGGGKKGFCAGGQESGRKYPMASGEAHACHPALPAPVCLSPVSAEDEASFLNSDVRVWNCALPFLSPRHWNLDGQRGGWKTEPCARARPFPAEPELSPETT